MTDRGRSKANMATMPPAGSELRTRTLVGTSSDSVVDHAPTPPNDATAGEEPLLLLWLLLPPTPAWLWGWWWRWR